MKQASTNTVKCDRKLAGAYSPTRPNSTAPTPNTVTSDCTDIGAPAPWPGPLGAAAGIAALGLGGAACLIGGAGQVIAPSLITVRPRRASSSMLTLMTPSLVLQSSSVKRSRLFEYSVDDCLARRLTRSV